jgi:hypothetical protein
MAARRIRSIVARFVVVTGLAAFLLAGSYGLDRPSDASAAKAYNCDDPGSYLELADAYYDLAAHYFATWQWSLGSQALDSALRLEQIYDSCTMVL